MIDHDYLSTDAPCPNCGGRMLADVAYDDRAGGDSLHQRVSGYDCQELECGSQFNIRKWAIRARSNGVYDSGLAALTNPTRTGNRA
ncbi:hypothetical protein DFJ75_4954 [Williamsia muralis]|uniref:Ogr/Delta-like zinc finger protein n=1 Tax=Williamsia marianensis TaxID=85044 RepID=A0A495IUX9_WILMA|nr:hypothetical protein DFJ75_4954 [Williamsia muralis]